MYLPVPYLFELKPNRVRRNYRGGRELERLESVATPQDNERPEDWIASTVLAKNPGLDPIENEGLTYLQWRDCPPISLKDCFRQFPNHMLGEVHLKRIGHELGFLTKLLDSAMRLHVQAHPTAQFAQLHLGSNHGKLESYVVLGVRDGQDAYLRLGFQKAVSAAEWKRIVLEQDIPAMDALFERVPVQEGEVWLVPPRLPHAIGEGLLVLEVMEPSDLVVRCEFEREGIVVPPPARFMGRDPDFALQIVDRHAYSVAQITRKCRIEPMVKTVRIF
jgi:mannose-6-phosphate isomerase